MKKIVAPRIEEIMEAAKARGKESHIEAEKALFWCQLRMNLDLCLSELKEKSEHPIVDLLREMAIDKAINNLLYLYHRENVQSFVKETLEPLAKSLAADTSDFVESQKR